MTFSIAEITPPRAAVLEHQGIPAGRVVGTEIEALGTAALALLTKAAAPCGTLLDISKSDFGTVYDGEGRNEPHTPVGDIFAQADHLALSAVTLGARISEEIEARFRSNDFALGCMLDSAASAAAEQMAELAESRFLALLFGQGRTAPATRVLGYSPGYCGWHLSGQRKLFEFLRPERIGISLRDSFLMEPLKSISGVLIAGPQEIHEFPNSYAFCSRCDTQGCRERIRAREHHPGDAGTT